MFIPKLAHFLPALFIFSLSLEGFAQGPVSDSVTTEYEICVSSVALTSDETARSLDACVEQAIETCRDVEDIWLCFSELAKNIESTNASLASALIQNNSNFSREIAIVQYEHSIYNSKCLEDDEANLVSYCTLVAEMAQMARLLELKK